MRKFYYIFVLAFSSIFSNAQNPDAFIMTWVPTPASSSNPTVIIPVVEDSSNNYTIDFGDGTVLTNQTGTVTHTYNDTFVQPYTITMTGTFKHIRFKDTAYLTSSNQVFSHNNWLRSIDQWGTNQWGSMQGAFYDCKSLTITATDIPDLSQVTNMSEMFKGVSGYVQGTPIGSQDMSNLVNWNVSNVTNMESMFQSSYFNHSINQWDVSNVTNMRSMFAVSSFNQLLDNWDVSNVTDMSYMFNATLYNQPLNNWDVSNVTDMSSMFNFSYDFNQPLDNWDVSNVTNMKDMFNNAGFNQDISNWNVSSVTDMSGMFSNSPFNQPLNNWDVSNVTDMSYMFAESLFNQPIGNWDVSSVTNLNGMFSNSPFNQPIGDWDVSNVLFMYGMFQHTPFNQPINDWDVSNVIEMSMMFNYASAFNQPLNNWQFNSEVNFHTSEGDWTAGFLSHSAMDITNYDSLLLQFADLQLTNKTLGAYGLSYCNSAIRDYLDNESNWWIFGDSLSENCENNIVYGSISLNENSENCEGNIVPIDEFFINANNGTPYYSTIPNNGEYQLNLSEGTYTLNLLNVPDYFTVNPESYTVNYTEFGNYEEFNFCLTANQTIQDLNIALLPVSEARPGFEAQYQLVVQNIGTQTVTDVQVTLNFDNAMQSFISASPVPTSTTNNQLYFEITSLPPFGSAVIDFTMQTFTPPTVNGDDILNFTAAVTPNSDDYTPEDNTFELAQVVVNSFDPNDKQVLQGDKIYIDNVDNYLHYLIRFQNTGTASAINVRIEDELHETLDWNTIQIINTSHDYRVEITEGNQIEFIFDNIHLPHETDDEAGSNGFIAYKIKPVQDLEVGDFIIGNEANIYFDFNEPIITNTTSTEIVNPTSGIATNLTDFILVYPNPTSDVLHIQTKGNIELQEVKIYNMQGRELYASQQHLQTVNITDLSSGIYLLNIKTNEGTISQRVIKK